MKLFFRFVFLETKRHSFGFDHELFTYWLYYLISFVIGIEEIYYPAYILAKFRTYILWVKNSIAVLHAYLLFIRDSIKTSHKLDFISQFYITLISRLSPDPRTHFN